MTISSPVVRSPAVLVLAAATLVLAGCTPDAAPPAPGDRISPSGTPTPRSSAPPSQVAVHDRRVTGYMEALLVGTLAVSDGCVVVETPNRLITPVFARRDVEWDGATLTLVPSGRRWQLGDEVALGGGESAREDETLPPGCPARTWAASPW